MINSANFKSYRTSETVQFFSDLSGICLRNNPENLQIQEQVKAITLHTESLNTNFKADRGSSITAELMDLDERRDKAFLCLKMIIEGYEYHYNTLKRDAAKDLLTIIEKYGSSVARLNYQSQTSTIRNMVEDLQSKAAYKLEILGVGDVATELKDANILFSERFHDRLNENAQNRSVAIGELIKSAIISYRNLTSHIVAHATLNPSEVYTDLIEQINQLIESYNNTVKLRSRNFETTI